MNPLKLYILLITFQLFIITSQAQTFWSSREYRIPGLGQKSLDVGLRFTGAENNAGTSVFDSTLFSITYGKNIDEKTEFSFGGALGGTDIDGFDNYTNFELFGDVVYKREKILESGAKLVPYVRAGGVLNYFSNYEETTIGYTWTHRYYTYSGESHFDVYGNYSAGLSYVGLNDKWAASTELGQSRHLFGDLDPGYELNIWTSQLYYGLWENSGLKFSYTHDLDYARDSWGLYWSKTW